MKIFYLFLGPKSDAENEKLVRFYLFFINRVNIIAKEHLMLDNEEADEEPGPSRKKVKVVGNRKKFKKKPKRSCIPHPSTIAWLV